MFVAPCVTKLGYSLYRKLLDAVEDKLHFIHLNRLIRLAKGRVLISNTLTVDI